VKNEVKERRKAPRISTRLALQVERSIRSATERPITTESLNLSSGGVCAAVRSPLEPMTKVGLTLLLPSFGRMGKKTQVISCHGVVVRCDRQTGEDEFDMACAFTDVKKEDKLLIEEYIGWRVMQDFVDERLSQP
jgi:c-di-GMP-binding flagellar brake protein YcgR